MSVSQPNEVIHAYQPVPDGYIRLRGYQPGDQWIGAVELVTSDWDKPDTMLTIYEDVGMTPTVVYNLIVEALDAAPEGEMTG
jgi:hypothetical protein